MDGTCGRKNKEMQIEGWETWMKETSW